jgi:hypothetical protein
MKKSLMINKRDFSQFVQVGNYYKVSFATKWVRGTVIFKLSAIDDHLKSTTYLFAEGDRVLELQSGKVKSTHSTCDNINGAVVKLTNIQHIEEATMEESRALRTYYLNKELETATSIV